MYSFVRFAPTLNIPLICRKMERTVDIPVVCVPRQPSKGDPKGKNKLTFSTEDNLTGKCAYFVRVNPKGVDAKTCETDVAYGEIVGTPLESLHGVLKEVFEVFVYMTQAHQHDQSNFELL